MRIVSRLKRQRLHAWVRGFLQVDLVDQLEVFGVENEDIFSQEEKKFSVRRNLQASFIGGKNPCRAVTAFILREVDRPNDLLLSQVDLDELGILNGESVNLLGSWSDDRVEVLAVGVHGNRAQADLVVAQVKLERTRHLSGGEINHLNAAVKNRRGVERLPIVRQRESKGNAGLEVDSINQGFGCFVDHQNVVWPGANIQQSLRRKRGRYRLRCR